MEAFTTTDISKILGIKRERVKNWLTEGYISPSIQTGEGPGTKHLFSRADLYIMRLFEYLLERGFSRSDASQRIKKVYDACMAEFEHEDQSNSIYRWNFIALRNTSGNPKEEVFHYFAFDDKHSMEAPISSLLDEECDDIVIINFGKIRRNVDIEIEYAG
jgi:DNA-binding transcriptional MerR regulator